MCKFALHFPMEVQRISYMGGSLILTMESDEDLYLEQLRDMIYNLNIHD